MQSVHTAPSPSRPSTHPSPGHHEKLINLPVCERVVRVPDLHLHLLLVPIIRFSWGTGQWQHQGEGKENNRCLDTTAPRSPPCLWLGFYQPPQLSDFSSRLCPLAPCRFPRSQLVRAMAQSREGRGAYDSAAHHSQRLQRYMTPGPHALSCCLPSARRSGISAWYLQPTRISP